MSLNENLNFNIIDEPSSTSKKLYIMIFTTNILLNVDQGIMPGATNIMMKYFNLNQAWFGLLGSSIYFGLIAGSFFAGILFQKYNTRKIIIFTCLGLCISLSIITYTKIYIILIFSRAMLGLFQVYIYFCIYFFILMYF